MEESKQFWKSKTFWLSVGTIIGPLLPWTAPLFTPEVIAGLGALFGVLRAVSSKALILKKK